MPQYLLKNKSSRIRISKNFLLDTRTSKSYGSSAVMENISMEENTHTGAHVRTQLCIIEESLQKVWICEKIDWQIVIV